MVMRGTRLAVWLTVSLVVALLPISKVGKVEAHGSYFFQPTQTPSATRIDHETATYHGRLEAIENGSVKNDNLGFVDLTLTLDLIQTSDTGDRWGISKVEFSNIGASTDNPNAHITLINSGAIQVTNANNESEKYDYSSPSSSGYGYVVSKAKSFQGWAIVLYDHFGTAQETKHGNGPGTDLDPIAGLTRGPEPTINNYDNPNGGGANYDLGTVQGWFNNEDISGLEITIYETKDNPPKVFVSRSKLSNRPPKDLAFKLIAVSGEGATADPVGNKDWLTFQGFLGEEKVDNLYLQVSDDLDANFLYGTNYEMIKKGNHPDSPGGTDAYNTTEVGRVATSEGDGFASSLGKLFTYIENIANYVDKDHYSDNCGQGLISGQTLLITGPKDATPKPDIATTTDKGVDGSHARGLNQNCINISANGWLQYWGVKDLFSATPLETPGSCNFGSLISGNGEIGTVFGKILKCLFDTIFVPMVEWAAKQVEYASGLSWLAPTERYYLITVSWT